MSSVICLQDARHIPTHNTHVSVHLSIEKINIHIHLYIQTLTHGYLMTFIVSWTFVYSTWKNWCISMGIYSYPIFRFRCRQEAKGYKDNFLIRCSTQQQSQATGEIGQRLPDGLFHRPLADRSVAFFPWWEQQTFSKTTSKQWWLMMCFWSTKYH